MNTPVRKFVEFLPAGAEHCTPGEAWTKPEGTRLMTLLREDSSLIVEDASLLYRCYCMELNQPPNAVAWIKDRATAFPYLRFILLNGYTGLIRDHCREFLFPKA